MAKKTEPDLIIQDVVFGKIVVPVKIKFEAKIELPDNNPLLIQGEFTAETNKLSWTINRKDQRYSVYLVPKIDSSSVEEMRFLYKQLGLILARIDALS